MANVLISDLTALAAPDDLDEVAVQDVSGEVTGKTTVAELRAAIGAGVTLSTTAPLTGGGDLSGDRTLAISPASGAAAGSMSAAHWTKLEGVEDAATADAASDATPAQVGDAGAAGVSEDFARADHVHARPAPRSPRSVAVAFSITEADHDRPIEYTGTGAVAATFDEAEAGVFGSIVLTGAAGTLTMTAGAGVTLLLEEGFTATSLAPSAGKAVTVSYQYLGASRVHVVGGLVSA